jgi:subtilase family serine protease
VVAAPLLPTAPPATHVPATEAAGDGGGPLILIPPLTLLFPDLSVSMEVPASAFLGGNVDVKVKVKNVGDIVASNFTVQWWAGAQLGCSWPVDTLAAGATKNLNCSYAFPNIGDFTVKTIVDSGATVLESNESNNMSQANLQVNQLILFLTPFFP